MSSHRSWVCFLTLLTSQTAVGAPASTPTSRPSVTPPPPSVWPSCKTQPLRAGKPEELGVDGDLRADLQALLDDAVATKQTHSASLIVLRRGKVLFRGQAGRARPDSVYDLASLTKVVATTPSVMRLVEARKLALSTRVGRRLRLMADADKREITVEQLLLHTSGLHSEVWPGPMTDQRAAILERVRRARLKTAPGSAYRYSDVGYIVLGELVGTVSGEPLDVYARRKIFEPLGMCDTGFNPPPRALPRLISPWPRGETRGPWGTAPLPAGTPPDMRPAVVYDPLAARLGGVAGHAGVYSTAEDLARFGQAMLDGGVLQGTRALSARTVATMLKPHAIPGETGSRGLGWDISSLHAGCCRAHLSPRAFGHVGFTGTSLWIDPALQLVMVLLTNRTWFTPAPSSADLRRRVHDLVATALERRSGRGVESGLDRLVASGFSELRGRRVALIINRTAIDRRGRFILDLLAEAKDGPHVVAVFAPEHGLAARVDRRIKDTTVAVAGRRVPVYSLFGSRRRPSSQTLAGVDTLVFDLQTVGTRYYTYLATMGWAMEEAAKHKLRFVVLDRPDPIGGVAVQGPLSSTDRRTSTNYHPLPVRYGMTVGELARMFNAERRIGVKLTVVAARGWRRDQLFPQTAQRWSDPSPNIRSWRQALLYAGVGMLESTNLAVGRGTDSPFALVGAPWIDGPALAAALRRRNLPGVSFIAVRFTPKQAPYRDQPCQGVRVVVVDPARFDAPTAGIAIAVSLRELHEASWKTKHLFRLINHPATTAAILAGKDLKEITSLWTAELERFRKQRARYLLYR